MKNNGLNLGQFIAALESVEMDKEINFSFCYLTPNIFQSYRGCYEDLCLTYKEPDYETHVRDILLRAREAVGKTFQGYKGGSYTMTNKSALWVSKKDCASDTIVTSLKETSTSVIIETKKCFE